MTISIDLLREFAVLVEERNFTRAARRLHITQPSLSKHILLLEESLQTKLFERVTPLKLSAAGEVFLEACASLLETYDSALGKIDHLRSKPMLSLRLAGPFFCKHFSDIVMPTVSATREEHGIEIGLISDPPIPFFKMLHNEQADIVFACASDRLDVDGMLSESVCHSQMGLALREGHRLLKHDSDIPLSELDEEPVLTFVGAYESWRLRFLELCDAHHIRPRHSAKQSGAFDLHLDGIKNEVVVICERCRAYLSFPGFEFRRIQDPDCFYDLRIFWREDSTNLAVPLFVHHIREQLHR